MPDEWRNILVPIYKNKGDIVGAWATTVWQAPTSAIPEEDDATSHVHLTLNSIVGAYHHLIPVDVGSIRTLSLSLVRSSPSSIKGDALSFNREIDQFY